MPFRNNLLINKNFERYDSNNHEKQRQAINNVLVNGEDYKRFCDELKKFFKDAKDNQGRTTEKIKINDILEKVQKLNDLL